MLQRHGVARDHRRVRCLARERHFPLRGERGELATNVARDDRHIDGCAVREGFADVGAGEREQVVGEARQALDFFAAALQHLGVFLRRARPAQGHFDFTAQDGERCAQLVRGVGHEAVLAGVRGFETVEQFVEGGGELREFRRLGRREQALAGEGAEVDLARRFAQRRQRSAPLADEVIQSQPGQQQRGGGTPGQPQQQAAQRRVPLAPEDGGLRVADQLALFFYPNATPLIRSAWCIKTPRARMARATAWPPFG